MKAKERKVKQCKNIQYNLYDKIEIYEEGKSFC